MSIEHNPGTPREEAEISRVESCVGAVESDGHESFAQAADRIELPFGGDMDASSYIEQVAQRAGATAATAEVRQLRYELRRNDMLARQAILLEDQRAIAVARSRARAAKENAGV